MSHTQCCEENQSKPRRQRGYLVPKKRVKEDLSEEAACKQMKCKSEPCHHNPGAVPDTRKSKCKGPDTAVTFAKGLASLKRRKQVGG